MHVNPFTYAHPISPLADMGERIRASVFAPRIDASASLSGSGISSALDATGHPPGGRLTVNATDAVPTTDTSNTSVYYVPYASGRVPLWNGSAWVSTPLGTPSVAIGTVTAGTVFDIFAYLSAGMVLIEKLAWTNPTTRATALSIPAATGANYIVKSGDTTRLYVGTVCAATTTAVYDFFNYRFVWNMYNRVARPLRKLESADTWTYNSTTLRPFNNSTANRVEFVRGLDEDSLAAYCLSSVSATNGQFGVVGIGLDSTTTIASGSVMSVSGNNNPSTSIAAPVSATWRGYPGIGYHYIQMLESAYAGTPTFFGDGGTPLIVQSGIHADGMF